MSDKKYISDEQLKKDFPLLFSRSFEEGIEAPDGYFQDLPGKVIERIKTENETKTIPIKRNYISRNIVLITSIAAVLIFGIFIINRGSDPQFTEDQKLTFTSLEISEISEDFLAELDEDIVMEALLSEDMELIDPDEEYTDYIYENDIDIEEYIYEL